MITRKDFDVVGSFNAERVIPIDAEQTVNLFEFVDPLGKKPKTLLPTSGLEQRIDEHIDDGGGRGSIVFNNHVYVVIKDTVYEIDDLLVINPLGTINTEDGYVGMDANTFQVILVDGADGWIFDSTAATFTQITAPGFPTDPLDVCFLDGFFIVPFGGTNEFGISALNDGTTWDPLDFALVTTHPGTITACKTLHRRLFLFEQNFTEVWENAGLGDFPFRRNNSLLMEFGTTAIASVRSGFDMLFFLSNDKDGLGPVMKVTGTQAIPASTQALDYQLQKYETVTDAAGILYKDNGIIFYRLNLTIANVTWVHNATMSTPQHQMWHREQMLDGSRHIAQLHFYFTEKNYFVHFAKGKIYEVDDTYLTNAGEAIKRMRITRQFSDESDRRIRIDRLQLDCLQGQGTPNGNDKNPTVIMFVSRDGGQTYGTGLRASIGKMGQRKFRTIWRKLGASYNFVFRFEFYNEVKFVILGGAMIFDVLPE